MEELKGLRCINRILIFLLVIFAIMMFFVGRATAVSNIEFYNYGIKTANIDYITKDKKILVNVDSLHNKIAGIKIKKTWNLISMSRGKKFIMISKKSSTIYVYGNENGVYMDMVPQKKSGKWYIQLDKICEALELNFTYSNNKFKIEEGGY